MVVLFITTFESPLFLQERIGKNRIPFTIIKLRTMKNGQITFVGGILRKTGIDEIPQLFNILRGDMSLIGPRPWLVEYLPLYNDFQRRRHEVKPGITGWAQVNGRNLLGWEDRFKHDIYYVDNICLNLDLKIFFLTIWNILTAKGISGDGHVTMKKFQGNLKNE